MNQQVFVASVTLGDKLWATTYGISDVASRGKTTKEIALDAVKYLAARMEKEIKEGNNE